MLIKGSKTAVYFCIFELLLKYSESIETFDNFVAGNNILIETVKTATNVDEARAQCASHDAILTPLDQGRYKFILLIIFNRRKGKLMKRAFCCKKIDIFIKNDLSSKS